MIPNFKISSRARERRFWLICEPWAIEELNLSWFVNYPVLRDLTNSFGVEVNVRLFSAWWLRFEQMNFFGVYLVTSIILQTQNVFLKQIFSGFTSSKQGSPSFLRERENVLVIIRDAWKAKFVYAIRICSGVYGTLIQP